MIDFIKGSIIEKNPAWVIIETASGLGYQVNISLQTYDRISGSKETCLLTHYIVREDAQLLFGFFEKEERELFRLLISVNGVGPSSAIMILSSLNFSELAGAINEGNVSLLKSVKGIGPKTAQRIIVELKDKVEKMTGGEIIEVGTSQVADKEKIQEALSALTMLGFKKNDAEKALKAAIQLNGPSQEVEDLVKYALKNL